MKRSEPADRRRKFRQAAFVYLHVGLLYEGAVWSAHRAGAIPPGRPILLWLLVGAGIVAVVFWGLWARQSAWLARIVWALGTLRLPALLGGAFFDRGQVGLSSSFYLVALAVVLANLWMLARAGWDL